MLEDFLRHLAKELQSENDEELRNAQLIGELPQEIVEEFYHLHRERERFEEDLQIKKRMYALEAERKLEEEFEPRNRAMKKRHDEVWNKVYKHMMIDPNEQYFHQNSKLYRKQREQENKNKSGIDFTNPIRNHKL